MDKLNVILLVAVSTSGLMAVAVQNQARRNYMVLDKAQKQETKPEQGYARLELGQTKLPSHELIEVAAEKQRLQPPSAHSTVMVEHGK